MTALLLIVSGTASGPASAQSDLGPQSVVRRFCQLDGLGQRTHTASWAVFAPLVEWPLEPVWDSAVVIAGYDVGPPRVVDLDTMEVEVRYSVVAQISPGGEGDQAYVERIVYRVRPGEAGWRIMGPPPAPHIFATNLDIGAARRAVLPGQVQFPTNSDFVWQMFRASGWEIDYEPTAVLAVGRSFRRVARVHPGDLIVYLNQGVGYHVGIFEDESRVISATINAGVLRTPIEAFAGDVVFLRLVEPSPPALPAPDVEADHRGDVLATVLPAMRVPPRRPPAKVATSRPVSTPRKSATQLRRATPTPRVSRGKARNTAAPIKSRTAAPAQSR